MEKQQISLVLPCYKPEPGWTEKVLLYYTAVRDKLSGTELFLVIVNDGSPVTIPQDDIRKLQEGIKNFSYYSYTKNRGKGYALRYGIARVVTSSVIYTDLDFPYTSDSFFQVAQLLSSHDVVIGIKDNDYYSKVPFLRKKISKWLRRMIRFFFPGIPTTDTQCGLKGLKGRAKDVFMNTRINDYLFDLEFIVGIYRDGKLDTVLQEVRLRDNVKFGRIPAITILRELLNFLNIIFSGRRPFPKN